MNAVMRTKSKSRGTRELKRARKVSPCLRGGKGAERERNEDLEEKEKNKHTNKRV